MAISTGLMSTGVIVIILSYVWYSTLRMPDTCTFSDLTVFYFSSIFRIHVRWQEVSLSYVRMAHGGNKTFNHYFSLCYVILSSTIMSINTFFIICNILHH